MALAKLVNLEQLIFNLRGQQIMLDHHLADLYHVKTKRLNEQVKRNSNRFPEPFMFQLTEMEWEKVKSQIEAANVDALLQSQNATAKRRSLPYAFTEQGVAMLTAVLKSDTAVAASIQIMDAFVKMRQMIRTNRQLYIRVEQLESRQEQTDQKVEKVFQALEKARPKPEKGIFFEGEIFDAYRFVVELIKKAERSIRLIDNYVDDSVLTLLSKRKENVTAHIYSKKVSKVLQLDLDKHNSQYPVISVHRLKTSHDRFLIIDEKELYHIGASLKDLGKKWFAFSRMDSLVNEVLKKLDNK